MPKQERIKTKYAGVYYIEGKRAGSNQTERIYYISFYKDGHKVEEKAGRQFKDDMTPAKANNIRAQKIEGAIPTNAERRKAIEINKIEAEKKWTIDRLWESYKMGRKPGKSLVTDKSRYNKYLKPAFGNKEPSEIVALEVDRMRISLLKKRAPQTARHILNLLTWVVKHGTDNGLTSGIAFKIKKPEVNNLVTEDLTPSQVENLLEEIEKDTHPQAGALLIMALFTGMRRGEMFKLKWKQLDFDRGFINIVDPKGKKDETIPMNDPAKELLENHPRLENSPYVFPGKGGRQLQNIYPYVNAIKKRAGIGKDFRVFHGLRHVFASGLASSGKVDLYTLQKLLTHKSPAMTQRYAHLRDSALRQASDVAADLFKPQIIDDKAIPIKEK